MTTRLVMLLVNDVCGPESGQSQEYVVEVATAHRRVN